MAFIVKGEQKIISPEDMKILTSNLKKKVDPLAGLSDSKKEIRKEVQDAKRHREFMGRVEANETKIVDEVIATSEIVTIAIGETISVVEETPISSEVDFNSMTKKQIDMWAEENLGIALDRRHTKAKLIEEIKKNL
jgi:hypothetical protein